MTIQIQSAKTAEVAAPPLKWNLQQFAGEVTETDTPVDEVADTDTEPVDTETETETDPGEGVKESEVADPRPERDLEKDRAFAELRRKAEAAEKQLQKANQLIAKLYGEHGITDLETLERAIQQRETEMQRQKYVEAGLPEEVIEKLSKVDEIIRQTEQEKFERMLLENFEALQKEYPDLVKSADDIPPEVWAKWNDGKNGITLTEAYELVNKKQIREHLQKSAQQAALNKVNSKSHVRPNGGDGGEDIDTTTIPPDVLVQYERMFAKELRTGKMTRADFVKHYKRSLKGQ